jgi:hypothetical protein
MNEQVIRIVERIKILSSNDADFDELVQQMHKLAALTPVSIESVCKPGTTLYPGCKKRQRRQSCAAPGIRSGL